MKSLLLASLLLLGLTMTVRSAQAADVRMYVRHEVNDYATWRKNYDAFKAERNKMGVIGAAVYRSVDNPNDVTVTHDFKNCGQGESICIVGAAEGGDGEGWRKGRSTNLVHHPCREIAARPAFWHLADIAAQPLDVRFRGYSGHRRIQGVMSANYEPSVLGKMLRS